MIFKSIINKLLPKKPVVKCCSKCGISESDKSGAFFYMECPRGRDFEDGYDIFAGGWQCDNCSYYEWVIADDNEWLETQDSDVVLIDVWEKHNKKIKSEKQEKWNTYIKSFELELQTTLDKVESAIKIFSNEPSVSVDELVNAGKILSTELEERKRYTVHILKKQAMLIGLNNEDRRLLRCWGYDEVEYENNYEDDDQ